MQRVGLAVAGFLTASISGAISLAFAVSATNSANDLGNRVLFALLFLLFAVSTAVGCDLICRAFWPGWDAHSPLRRLSLTLRPNSPSVFRNTSPKVPAQPPEPAPEPTEDFENLVKNLEKKSREKPH